ncbi:MAG: YceI family protein [Verrucomicrobiota bacterium]|jgi:polyisoprenoid-binding protein YceI
MRTQWIPILLLPALAVPALAAPETFDFKDPKGVNAIIFKLDAPLEAINGSASGVTGTVTFDPQNPGATTGKIVIAGATMTVPNATQTEHMRSSQWLDVEKNPEITFEAKALKNVKTNGDKTTADVSGAFTLHGVSKELTIPVELSYLKDKLGERLGGNQKGDLLVLRSSFSIKRGDFNIMPGQMENKVSDTIALTVGIVGASGK